MLEDSVEEKLLHEEQALSEESKSPDLASSDDVATLQQRLRELKTNHDTEIEQLRKRQSEAEMKSARTVHQLNKEIGELESLIEAKIYREDELERELERVQEKLSRSQKKSSRNGLGVEGMGGRGNHAGSDASGDLKSNGREEVCEICERPGHDIFTCDLLKGGERTTGSDSSKGDLFCEDCEERGHTAANCPHSLDVF